ncbi:MAG: MBL fold metallo-hydrolase [Bacteroidetes bacterium]|nr:MBL fold metallo-hydrolase [Bacteroidota bacterium]
MRITLLGTGTSVGIPMIGCDCETCHSIDPKDQRLRTACHIQVGELSIIIDTGPDFRQQMLRANIRKIDSVLWTHHHYDHIMGLDDLRPYFFECFAPMACFAHRDSIESLKRIFPYIWGSSRMYPGTLNLFIADRPFMITSRYGSSEQIEVIPIEVFHGSLQLNGYRMGNFAYVTDVSHIPEPEYTKLEGLDLLVLDALRPLKHPRHFSINEAIEVAFRIKAKQTVFTHMAHQVLHDRENAQLPESMLLGYDGMLLESS